MPSATKTSQTKFLDLLRRDILKLDRAELDFGIYRILNYRRDEINAFLGEQLPRRMEAVLQEKADEREAGLKTRLADLEAELSTLATNTFGLSSAFTEGVLAEPLKTTMPGREYLEKAQDLAKLSAEAAFDDDEEERLYNALYTFFARYYEDGDFLPQPRRGREARFSVPYQGEDVHFSWRGRGSHYVKTSEQLRSYAFRLDGADVRFEFVSADLEQDNVKGDRRYLAPLPDPEVTEGQVTLYFAHRPLTAAEAKLYNKTDAQEGLIESALEQLMPKLSGVTADAEALRKHMKRYARKHTEDYFVHPDLGAFLKAEFDYYLKNEYLNVDALTSAEAVTDRFLKFKALQAIGYDIITFLDQIESFQAALFEKRRFVLQTDYLAPMRLLSDELKEEAIKNEAQVQAWRDLFAIQGDIDKAFADSHPTLVVDTRHFDRRESPWDDNAFKTKLLSLFDDLDEATDGLLIHAENYGALRTLAPKYAGKVKVIYIDPPYNTGNDGFLYKDDFSRHSTWLTMMEERLGLGRSFLLDDGVIFTQIGDEVQANLRELLDAVFGEQNFKNAVIVRRGIKNVQAQFEDISALSVGHDTIFVFTKSIEARLPKMLELLDEGEPGKWDTFWRGTDRPTMRYEIFGEKPNAGQWRWGKERALKAKRGYEEYLAKYATKLSIDEYYLKCLKETGEKPSFVRKNEDGVVQYYVPPRNHKLRSDVWLNVRTRGSFTDFVTEKHTNLIETIVDWIDESGGITLDFFAGSGATGHSVINLNRAALNGERKKFILVEMDSYFDSVLLTRIQKVMYAPDWSGGKPASEPEFPLGGVYPDWVERSPRLVKVLRLESYEDSLNALELPQERSLRAQGFRELFGKDYLLKYLLCTEVGDEAKVFLNTALLEKPFDYRLKLYTPEGMKEQPVDLVETFNLLMGFHVKRMSRRSHGEREYALVEAQDEAGSVLVVWRDVEGLDPKAERAFLENEFDLSAYHTVYANADIAVPKGQSLDREFKDRLLARATGVLA